MSSSNFEFTKIGTGVKHTTNKGTRSIRLSLDPQRLRSIPDHDLGKIYLFQGSEESADYSVFALVPRSQVSLATYEIHQNFVGVRS